MNFLSLPSEIIVYLVYTVSNLSPQDILNLALACKRFKTELIGTRFDKDLLRSMAGFEHCINRDRWRAARLALSRNRYGNYWVNVARSCLSQKIRGWEYARLYMDISKRKDAENWQLEFTVPAAIHYAQKNNLEQLAPLVVNYRKTELSSVLSFCCKGNEMECFSFLVDKIGNDVYCYSAMKQCIRYERVEKLQILMDIESAVDRDRWQPLFMQSGLSNKPAIFSLLLAKFRECYDENDMRTRTLLSISLDLVFVHVCKCGYANFVEVYLDEVKNITCSMMNEGFEMAVCYGHARIMKMIIARNKQSMFLGIEALKYVFCNRMYESLQLILETESVILNFNTDELISLAIRSCSPECMQCVLDYEPSHDFPELRTEMVGYKKRLEHALSQ